MVDGLRISFWKRVLQHLTGRETRLRRRALACVRTIFDDRQLLQGTSLRREHRSRAVYVRHQSEDDTIVVVRFGIVRHPRPYAFSRQVHQVAEFWDYWPAERRLERVGGVNLSRLRGQDGDPGAT